MFEEKSFSAKSESKANRTQLSDGDNPRLETAVEILNEGEITACQPVLRGSNYVYLMTLRHGEENTRAIYKPRRGEAPLWDFPDGTLYLREFASYLVSEALKWSLIPATIIRKGPYGIGMVQQFIQARQTIDYSRLFDDNVYMFQRIAAFDWLVNNADRKIGHCLEGRDGRIWLIDHGLTFHEEPKLRTVIWDFAGQQVPEEILADLEHLLKELNGQNILMTNLSQLLSRVEIQALRKRLAGILNNPVFPSSYGSRHSVPWPPY